MAGCGQGPIDGSADDFFSVCVGELRPESFKPLDKPGESSQGSIDDRRKGMERSEYPIVLGKSSQSIQSLGESSDHVTL